MLLNLNCWVLIAIFMLERELFLQNVWKEIEGKELKLSHSQGCSRLMERLILLGSHSQLKQLFQTFSGQYVHSPRHVCLCEPNLWYWQFLEYGPAPIRVALLRDTVCTGGAGSHKRNEH